MCGVRVVAWDSVSGVRRFGVFVSSCVLWVCVVCCAMPERVLCAFLGVSVPRSILCVQCVCFVCCAMLECVGGATLWGCWCQVACCVMSRRVRKVFGVFVVSWVLCACHVGACGICKDLGVCAK